jgi:hypothetical protein
MNDSLAIGGSIAPPLLLLTILFSSSQWPLPNASTLALGYFTTCAVIRISGHHLFGGAESTVTNVGRIISATVGALLRARNVLPSQRLLGGLRAWVIVGALQGRH